MNAETIKSHHIVMSMTPSSDCRFFASWLQKVAEAGEFLSQAMGMSQFANLIRSMHMFAPPDIQAAAVEVLCALRTDKEWPFHTSNDGCAMAVGLDQADNCQFGVEVAILIQLGFFTLLDGRYHMSVPETVTPELVQAALLKVASTQVDDTGAQPQCLLHSMPEAEAEAKAMNLRNAA
ncbi:MULTISPECIES: hypothetical protein [Bradyrhizobium]|uniref:Uncharacterized protein n=1 Tax=Bradyrhizobium ottawaense TaxID=931866 RepID=A0ABV4FM65_9BRAD|nr:MULTISPECIES: hypothetical protein [Bradyrhizobium]MBR1290346.1 hypothetical protein [Bradyrhizobium ottawaense]MDA9486356.1 hypothetical protein [Bradyrhizobium sp. CCBAU 11445]WLB44747.1 hypothetical protein QIH93_30115 [Bradyrhizobium ottawaense]WQN82045.1 hypothetical protein U7859_34575 [Bradyrhizobium ottawaense]BBO03329.1 hypothetical protein SG09_26790 [Bradyrhizobium ottawaense]